MILALERVAYTYEERVVFQERSLEIDKTSCVAICGPNGSGKSTLLKILAGLIKPTKGNRRAQNGLSLGYLFQDSKDQFIAPMVIEDVAFSLFVQGVAKEEAFERAYKVLEVLGITHLERRSIHALSGGERRLAAIAGVLVGDYDVWILDEPMHEIDRIHEEKIEKILRERRCPLVFSTHDRGLVERLAATEHRMD